MVGVGGNRNTLGLRPDSVVMIPNRSSSDEDLKRLQDMEQRRKRMIKSWESARRSRIRKLEKLHEFKALINHLKEENTQSCARLSAWRQSCCQLATENATLRANQNPRPRLPLPLVCEKINAASSSIRPSYWTLPWEPPVSPINALSLPLMPFLFYTHVF